MAGRDLSGRFLGWCYRAADRVGLPTRAGRQATLHGRAVRPAGDPPVHRREGAAPDLQVLLLGNGPAESVGVASHDDGFGAGIADALAVRTGRAVQVVTIAGGDWAPDALATDLQAARLHWYDAVVVIATYRPALADVPLDDWRRYTGHVRDVLLEAAGPEPAIEILALPWHDASARAPQQWGGAFGSRIAALAATADGVLEGRTQIARTTLLAPAAAAEWLGPAFSPTTYRRWGDQVAEQLQERLAGAPPDRS